MRTERDVGDSLKTFRSDVNVLFCFYVYQLLESFS